MRKMLVFMFLLMGSLVYPESFERIISLGPAITEELYLLGAGSKIVGVTTYCTRPREAQKKQKVGTVMQINVEKIVSLRPGVVIATPLTDKLQLEKLKRLGVNVISFPQAKNFSSICDKFIELGRIVGEEKRAEKIVKKSKIKVNKITNRVKYFPRLSVFIQLGTKPIYTITKDSFINDYIELAGGKSIVSGRDYGLYSREEVIKEDPSVIIITAMGIAGENEKRMWERFGQLKAVRNKRIYIIDSYKFCSPTPVSFAQMLEELVYILHG